MQMNTRPSDLKNTDGNSAAGREREQILRVVVVGFEWDTTVSRYDWHRQWLRSGWKWSRRRSWQVLCHSLRERHIEGGIDQRGRLTERQKDQQRKKKNNNVQLTFHGRENGDYRSTGIRKESGTCCSRSMISSTKEWERDWREIISSDRARERERKKNVYLQSSLSLSRDVDIHAGRR